MLEWVGLSWDGLDEMERVTMVWNVVDWGGMSWNEYEWVGMIWNKLDGLTWVGLGYSGLG